MRLIVIFVLFGMVASKVTGQQAPGLVGAQFDYSNTGQAYHPGTGISIEGWLGDHFSFNYSFLYTPIGNNEYYLYTGGGQAAGVYLIRKAISKGGLQIGIPLGIAAFVLPESYGFRIPLSTKSQLGFFLAPYGFDFIKNRNSGEEDHYISYELGCRYYLAANQWVYLIPQIGMKSIYGDDEVGISFGLSVMFRVKQKELHDDL